ncbi:MAG: rRNA pseudouridine synthase [Oscillospiraceae bacterium]|nr:rRNA pseudouridine synthase [Oscillospiraceae bacterium]
MKERLQKILSRYGVASRRNAETMIAEGRVRLNGKIAQIGDLAEDGADRIEVDGKLLTGAPERKYLMLNKPRGYVTTLSDEKGRRTVAELVADCGFRVYPVGRLDLYSEGLLLLTNDGDFAQKLMHPRHRAEKQYELWVSRYTPGAEEALRRPIELDGRQTIPAEVRLIWHKGDTAMLQVILREGRNRQIRRLCEAAGLTATRLRRVREGSLSLGDLPVGAWRPLTETEIASLEL